MWICQSIVGNLFSWGWETPPAQFLDIFCLGMPEDPRVAWGSEARPNASSGGRATVTRQGKLKMKEPYSEDSHCCPVPAHCKGLAGDMHDSHSLLSLGDRAWHRAGLGLGCFGGSGLTRKCRGSLGFGASLRKMRVCIGKSLRRGSWRLSQYPRRVYLSQSPKAAG